MSQQFCLKWNNHSNNMMDVFKNLLSTEAMVDVTLACDGLSLKAHKIVLSACSPFFQSLFLENPCKHPIVILKDMRYTELKAIIEFMYHGEVNVAQEQLSALMKTAETLRVKGLAEVTNEKNQSGDESPRRSASSRAGTPPPKRRKGRTRKRSVSDQSDDEQSKSKHPDSDIEELSSDMDRGTPYSTAASTVPLQSSRPSSFRSQQHEQPQPLEQNIETFEPEEKFNIEPTKLLQQSLTTDDVQRRSGRSSVHSNMEVQRRPQSSSTDHSTSLVPVTPSPMSSDALVSVQQPESPPDIKPELLDLEPPMSPVAGPSHSTDENSMMYMDQTNMSGMSGAGSYQDSSALMTTDGQSQGEKSSEFENKILRKVFKNPHLTVEKPTIDHDIVEMTFAVKTEPESEEIESDSLLKMAPPNMQNPHVTLENYPFENFSSSFQAILPHATPVNVSGSAEVKMETSNYDEEITRSSFMQLDIPIFIKGEVIEAENIIEEAIPLIDIAQEDFEDGKQKQQPEEHADNKVWKFVKIFKNAKCADEFLRSEKTWSYHYEDDIEEGARIYYKCNKINLEGPECPAELYLLFHKASGAVILYRAEVNHYHLTNLPSNYDINNKEVG